MKKGFSHQLSISILLGGVLILGGVAYATVTITSPGSNDWCGENVPGCTKEITVNLTKDPESMKCPEPPPPPCTSNCGTSGGGGSTTGSAP